MNYTVADVLYSGFAFVLFALFLIPPGYAIGWTFDLLSFRKQDPGVKFLLSLPLSIALTPILVYLIGRYSLGWPVWTLYGILFATFLAVCRIRGVKLSRMLWIVSGCWIAISLLSLVDWQIGRQVYYSVVSYDYNFRSAVTSALVRAHSLPAANPFFANGEQQMFRYHYFWFLICALPVRLAHDVLGYTGLTARHAVIASSLWAGLGLFSITALYVRFFCDLEEGTRRRVTWIAISLFGVSGLDIIPTLLGSGDGLNPTVDWWNADQVTGWVDSMLWVPHALGSLIACMTGFLILWERPKYRWAEVIAAGLAFASGVGLSIYVSLVFALFAALWTALFAMKRDWNRLAEWSAAGTAAAILTVPFLRELTAKPGVRVSFLKIEIRHFQPAMELLDSWAVSNHWLGEAANLLCLPLGYFLELGFFFLAGWAGLRLYRSARPADLASRMMLISSLVFCSVIRSNTIQMNDLGVRGMLIAQFVLVLWGARWLAEPGRWKLPVKAAIAGGLLTTGYELALMRTFTILADRNIIAGAEAIDPDADTGLRGFSARQVYQKLDRIMPGSAILQHNPSGTQDIMAGLYANRQFAIMDLATAITFTGDQVGPRAVLEPLKQLFSGERNDATAVCRQLGIDSLVVKDIDPAWQDPASWVWHTPVLAKAELVMGLDCRANGTR